MTYEKEFEFREELRGELGQLHAELKLAKHRIDDLASLYVKLESSLQRLDTAATKLETIISIQERTLSSIDRLLQTRDDKVESNIKAIKEEFKDGLGVVQAETNLIKERISSLERHKWIMYGGIIVLSMIGDKVLDLIFSK